MVVRCELAYHFAPIVGTIAELRVAVENHLNEGFCREREIYYHDREANI